MHGYGPAPPASRRVRILLVAVLVPVALATLVGLWLTWPDKTPSGGVDIGFGQRPVHGEVFAAASAPCTSGSSGVGRTGDVDKCISLDVQLTDGDSPGVTIQQVLPDEPSTPRFSVGDHVMLAYTGENPAESGAYQIQDFQRGVPTLWLVALFAAAVLLLGRWRDLASLIGLGFLVLMVHLFPAILTGENPVLVGVPAASLIMFGVLYPTHGGSAQTSSAVLGTVLSLALIGVLGTAFAAALHRRVTDRTRPCLRLLGGEHPGAGLCRCRVARAADLLAVRTELRHADHQPERRPGGGAHAGRQHRAGRCCPDHHRDRPRRRPARRGRRRCSGVESRRAMQSPVA